MILSVTPIVAAIICAFACFPSSAQVLDLTGDYAGTATFGSAMDSYVEYGAQGGNVAAISGLTTVCFDTGGLLGWKDSTFGYFWGGERVGCSLVASDGSSLRGMCSGQGWTDSDISGSFRIDRGTGRFEGYGGGGLWTSQPIKRIPGTFPSYDVLIHVEGKAEPVPEPTTLALLLSSAAVGTAMRQCRSRRFF